MILKNGLLAIGNEIVKKDILIENGIIKKIDTNIQGDDIIDISGKYVVPGGIDVHTHMNIDVGIKSVDDFKSGSIAAAFGGTTTIIDHPGFGPKGCSLHYMIDKYKKDAKESYIDYSFHGVIQEISENTYEEMAELKESGINSFKIYLTYLYKQNDEEILKIFEIAKKLDVIIAVHAENDMAMEHLKRKFEKENKTDIIYHSYSRPVEVEAEAVYRLISLASIIGYEKLYLVHISSAKALEQIEIAKRDGKKIFVETCPQYLYLDEDNYLKPDGIKYVLSPPLRKEKDRVALWSGINNGIIDLVGSDHCTFSLKEKEKGRESFLKCPNGIPGVEERNLLLFSEVLKNKLSVEKYLNIVTTNPAKIFGLKQKGSIEVGKDADLVIFEKKESFIDEKLMHSNAKYSCFDKQKINCKVDRVYLRGLLIIKDDELKSLRHEGKNIKR